MRTKLTIAVALLIALSTLGTAQAPTVSFDPVLISTDPSPVQSGDDADITFKVRHTGNTDAENVSVEIMDSYPFQLKPDRKRNYELGTIVPGESYHISTEVLVAEGSPDGNNDFKIRIKRDNFEKVAKLPVNVQSEDIELNLADLKTSPSDLKPDTDNNEMTVDIVNNGDKTAENVVLNLDIPQSFEKKSSFSTREALGNLESGETKEAVFNFDISENASKGSKEIPAQVSYTADDNTAEITEDHTFEIFLSGRPQYRINSIESDLQAGEKGQIKVEVVNYGSEKSKSTRVRVLDNSDLPFEFDSANNFMGSLKPGSKGTIVFEPTVDSNAVDKEYLLDLEIRGVKDSEVFVEQKVRGLIVKAEDEKSGFPFSAILIALLILGIGLGYYRRKDLREIFPDL